MTELCYEGMSVYYVDYRDLSKEMLVQLFAM